LSGRGSARRLTELTRVEGLGPDGDYRTSQATQNNEGDHS
ncbi:MAG: P-type conjugative transfer ATPase TrbB, partial [Mesorhizobium sp.]